MVDNFFSRLEMDLWDRLVRLEHEKKASTARVKTLEAELHECRDYLDNYADVIDGSYGEPRANRAMELCAMIDETLGEQHAV